MFDYPVFLVLLNEFGDGQPVAVGIEVPRTVVRR